MNPSRLIQRRGVDMALQTRTDSIDSGGGSKHTFATRATVKVFWQPRGGSEAVRYGRESNRGFGIGYMQSSVTVNKNDRLLYGTRKIDIQDIHRPDERVSGQSMSFIAFSGEETED